MTKLFLTIALIILTNQVNAQTFYSDFRKFDENLYIIWFEQYGCKALIAEFDEYLAVVEFPINDSVAIAIINKAKEIFPEKPIKYVLHSHHHSHSISGFDPFLEHTKASLVTSPYNFAKIKSITLDTIQLEKRYVKIDSTFKMVSNNNELICYTINRNQYAVPTQEYNVIYFPYQKLLVTGCLYQKPLDYHQVVDSRKYALKQLIDSYIIKANYLLPTNTCRKTGFEDICTIGMLDSTLLFGIKPIEVADFFQSKSISYFDRMQDSLIIEFKKIPSYYDYYTCARELLSRKDYDKALIIFNLIINVYPEYSHNVYLYTGECYESKGDKEKAKYFYEKYIACAVSESETNYGKQKINNLENRQ